MCLSLQRDWSFSFLVAAARDDDKKKSASVFFFFFSRVAVSVTLCTRDVCARAREARKTYAAALGVYISVVIVCIRLPCVFSSMICCRYSYTMHICGKFRNFERD